MLPCKHLSSGKGRKEKGFREGEREMVRAPCCEKMGLKKGPWTPEEDRILISYIQQHGHGNWRALPKQAGLLRCGKSCRLRWTNYLRPDIKRGNFSKEEEETIIKLHEMLGNRWSAIAARLPGRTDNEIKNVWHTHLKKRLKNYHPPSKTPTNLMKFPNEPVSPQNSSSELSSVTEVTGLPRNLAVKDEQMDWPGTFPQIDESFWSEDFSGENEDILGIKLPSSPAATADHQWNDYGFKVDDSVDFWYNLLNRAGGPPELPEF